MKEEKTNQVEIIGKSLLFGFVVSITATGFLLLVSYIFTSIIELL